MRNGTIRMAKVVVALALLLPAGAAQAQVVLEGTQAIGIDSLDVDGTIYDVDFSTKTNPRSIYRDFPGELDFIGLSLANVARDAVGLPRSRRHFQ
jgi:hypothetical protein